MAGAASLTEQNESPNENTQKRRALHPRALANRSHGDRLSE
ncbi:uncharacterized, partial [Tachysurus ichikawai]